MGKTIAAFTFILLVVSTVAAVAVVPEVRCWFGLEKCPEKRVDSSDQKQNPPTIIPKPEPTLHKEDKDGNLYVINATPEPNCLGNFKTTETTQCYFTHTQLKKGNDNTPYDHWDLWIKAPGPVYDVDCRVVGPNEHNEVDGVTKGQIDHDWGICTGWINGGNYPIQMQVYYQQKW